jgi:hypothetical protein
MGKSKVQKSSPIKSTSLEFTIVRLDYVKSKRAGNLLSKLALSNALVQNANEETVNIPTKIFSSLFSEAIETTIVPINLLRILLCEGKEPSSFVVIVDDVAKEMKTQNKKQSNHQRVLLDKEELSVHVQTRV